MNNLVHIILNPVAGSFKGSKIEPLVRSLAEKYWPGQFELVCTRYAGEAVELAARIGAAGNSTVVAAGGDGTINEVINGLLSQQPSSGTPCTLGIINCGSGAGLAQTLHLPSAIEAQIEGITTWPSSPLDVGLISYTDPSREPRQRRYISECQIGLGGAVVSRVSTAHKRFGGKVAFGHVAVGQLFAYHSTQMELRCDGYPVFSRPLIGIVAGNGSRCAGGMRLTPDAQPFDGLLDVLSIFEMSLMQRIRSFSKVYTGQHVRLPYFDLRQAREIAIESDPPVWVESDGELLGVTPCSIRIEPGAVQVIFQSKNQCYERRYATSELATL